MSRRVVITGVGVVSPLGNGASTLHERWKAGECGIESGVGACNEFEPAEVLTKKELRRTDRFAEGLSSVCFSPGGRYALLGSAGKWVDGKDPAEGIASRNG